MHLEDQQQYGKEIAKESERETMRRTADNEIKMKIKMKIKKDKKIKDAKRRRHSIGIHQHLLTERQTKILETKSIHLKLHLPLP